jgi:hypothetical protein
MRKRRTLGGPKSRHYDPTDEGELTKKGYTSGQQVPGQDPQTLTARQRRKRLRKPRHKRA